jgi:thiosulfate reductase/polysulfide reductase chain A
MEENTAWINPKSLANGASTTVSISGWKIRMECALPSPYRPGLLKGSGGTAFTWSTDLVTPIKTFPGAYGKGASDSELITKVWVDPIMGGTGMRGNFVTFKFEPKEEEVES